MLRVFMWSWSAIMMLLLTLLTVHEFQGGMGVQAQSESSSFSTQDCHSYSQAYKRRLRGVCVCNSTQCHSIPSMPASLDRSAQAVMFTTSKAGKRFEPAILTLIKQENNANATASRLGANLAYHVEASIDLTKRFQTILGFGGAWTDSASINIYKMSPQIQQDILESYYGTSGLQYTIGRIPMASADFSEYVYSYNDNPNDFDMTNFSIATDLPPKSNKIPMIHRALALSERNISIFASPWAPPIWMTNENDTIDCSIKGYPDGSNPYWKAWGLYFSKFLTAYQEQGIQIAAVTTQNEPIKFNSMVRDLIPIAWQSLRINATQQRDWIKNELGPRLRSDHPDVKIILMDDNKPGLAFYAPTTLDDPEAAQYVSGVGIHWYMNYEFVVPGHTGDFELLAQHHENYPDVFILATEACEGAWPVLGTGLGPRLTRPDDIWQRGENYARDIIGDLQNYAVGWTDWNIVLDVDGGPNWARNFVDAPILVDVDSRNEWYKQPMYYVMGHFSKYIVPGSVRVNLDFSKRNELVEIVAFLTPDQDVVVVLQNRNHWLSRKFRFQLSPTLSVEGVLERDSVSTLLIPSAAF